MAAEPDSGLRRFYTEVDIAERDGGFAVLLDGKAVKTPAKRTMLAPTRALAELLAREWASQGERIEPQTMIATRLLNVALDRAPGAREEIAGEVTRYAETDLVCHLADDDPDLARLEEASWAPLRAWAEETLGVALAPVAGVLARPQPQASLEAIRSRALALDDVALVALAHATALLGSIVLALALLEGRLAAGSAFAASRVDDARQAERWGIDAEAEARAERLAEELGVVERVMRAAGHGRARDGAH
jgi:chaperone required for assembly of F1-ATPase